jgi:hypothetical protein
MITSSSLIGTAPVDQFAATDQSFGPLAAVPTLTAAMVPPPPVSELVTVNGTPATSAVKMTVSVEVVAVMPVK